MLDKIILRNISSLFSVRIAGYIIPLITLPYLVRVLEPVGYGTLGFCLAIVQYFIIVVNYGFDLSATQKISINNENKLKLSEIFWSVLAIRVFISVFGFFGILILSVFFKNIYLLLPVLLSLYVSVFASALFPQWLFQGKEQLGTISMARIIIQVLSVVPLFIFVKNIDDIWIAALLSSMPSFLIVILSAYIIIKRDWVFFLFPSINSIKVELKDGWYLFLSSAAISLYTTSTTVILGVISGPVSVAIFISANKLLQAAQSLYSPISASFYPRINKLMERNKKEAMSMIQYLLKIQTILTVFISVCLFTFSPYVIELLFGPQYEESSIVLRVMSVMPVVIGLSNIFGVQVLLTHGYKKEFTRILLLSGIISLFSLVPLSYFYGAQGAAISVVITELFVTALMLKKIIDKKIPLFKRVDKNEI